MDLESDEVYDIISNPHTPIAFAITWTEKNPANRICKHINYQINKIEWKRLSNIARFGEKAP